MVNYTALYDACVLYPAPLRDLLLNLAQTGLFRARWTKDIHAEWIRNLVQAGYDRKRLERTRELMDKSVLGCLITGYEGIIQTLQLPDNDDRHVLAAAIVGGADVIVTANLKHFPTEKLQPFGIAAQHPDDFIVCQIDLSPEKAYSAVKKQRANLKNPSYTVEEFLTNLEKQHLPQTVVRLREASELI